VCVGGGGGERDRAAYCLDDGQKCASGGDTRAYIADGKGGQRSVGGR